MTDGQPAMPEKITATQVVEMFTPQLDAVSASIDEARGEQTQAETAFGEAEQRLAIAKTDRADRLNDVRQAEMKVHAREQRLKETQGIALAALGATDLPSAETFIAQTLIESGSDKEATELLDKARGVNEQLAKGNAIQRLIVIGSLPVISTVQYPARFQEDKVSFIELDSKATLDLRRVAGRHYIGILPQEVSQIDMPDRDTKVPYHHRDTTGHYRLIATEPVELKFVSTKDELAELIQGSEEPSALFNSYGRLSVGSDENNNLLPAIISGEAVDRFTEWLAQSESMRVLVFASLTATGREFGAEIPELPEDSEVLQEARTIFKEYVQTYAKDLVGNNIQEQVEIIERLKSNPLFSREVQEYLGIGDDELADYLTEALQPGVDIKKEDEHYKDLHFRAIGGGVRSFYSVDTMCDLVQKKFGEGGFGISSTSIMWNVARDLKIGALRKEQELLKDTRASRKLKNRIKATIQAIEYQYSSY